MYTENNKWHIHTDTRNGYFPSPLSHLPISSNCCHRFGIARVEKRCFKCFFGCSSHRNFQAAKSSSTKYTINNGVDKNHFRFILFIGIIHSVGSIESGRFMRSDTQSFLIWYNILSVAADGDVVVAIVHYSVPLAHHSKMEFYRIATSTAVRREAGKTGLGISRTTN